MSEATIRARIKTVLGTVSNIGQVYDYERWAADETTFRSLFTATVLGASVLRAWTISTSRMEQVENDFDSSVVRRWTYRIRGYLGLDDSAATEKASVALAVAVCDALDADATLQGFYETTHSQIPVIEPRIFGGALVNAVEIELMVAELA